MICDLPKEGNMYMVQRGLEAECIEDEEIYTTMCFESTSKPALAAKKGKQDCGDDVRCDAKTGADQAQYSDLSMTGGIGLISVPSSCSILYKLKRSSIVIKLIARPRWPNRPLLPTRCK